LIDTRMIGLSIAIEEFTRYEVLYRGSALPPASNPWVMSADVGVWTGS